MKKINQFFIRIKTNLVKTNFLVAVFSLLLLSCNKKQKNNSQQEKSVIVVVQDLSMSMNPSSTEIAQERKFVSRFLEKEMSSNFDLMLLYSNSTSNSVTNNFKIEWQVSEKASSGYQSKSAKMLEESVMESENKEQKSAMINRMCKKLFDEIPKQKKDAENKAQTDTEKLKNRFGLSDLALGKVTQISVLIPTSVDKEKTITPQYYYKTLFENFSYRKPIEWHSL